MNIEYVQIPAPLFESPEYHKLSNGCQKLLMSLYSIFYDTETFTIELHEPRKYYESPKSELNRKVAVLVKTGFLVIDSYRKTPRSGRRRVFKFKEWK